MTNILPLESFREILGWHPFHFWGLADNKIVPVDSNCIGIISEHSYQSAYGVGRDQIRQAIETAERKIMDYLEYPIVPLYVTETLDWPTYFNRISWRVNPVGADDKRVSVRLKYGKIQAVGVETYSEIGQPTVVLQDLDNDGLNESWLISMHTGQTDAKKIVVAFLETERTSSPIDIRRWTIAPLNISIDINTGTLIIKGKTWQIANPTKYEGFKRHYELDPTDVSKLSMTLQLYARTIDMEGQNVDNGQGVLLWNTDRFSTSSDAASIGSVMARVGIVNSETGLVAPAQATLNVDTGLWEEGPCPPNYREPDQVIVRYVAGIPLDMNGEISYDLRVAVARMAMAELGRPACGCEDANKVLYHWQQDMSRGGGRNTEQFQITQTELNNPFGKMRGHVWAWQRVKDLKLVRGYAP